MVPESAAALGAPEEAAADRGPGDSPPPSKGHVFVLLNPKAGRCSPSEVREALASAFEPTRWELRVHEPPEDEAGPEGIRRIVKEAIGQGAQIVVAAGGDGTVSLVANALAWVGEPRIPLGIIPLGTANILARELRIPVVVQEAILLLISGHSLLEIDAMRLGDRHYFTQIGTGPDALMIEETSREAQQKLGRLAYMIALFRRAFGHRSQRFEFDLDGRRMRLRAWQVVLANARTLGAPPFTWGPHVDLSDGVVDVCVYDVRTPTDILRAIWTLFAFRHRQDPNARFLRARKSVVISTRRPLAVQADGESIGETPIQVTIVPKAVRLLVPVAEPGVEPGIEPRREHLRRLALRQRFDQRVATIWHVDAAVFLWINRLPRRKWLDVVMTEISASMPHGEGWLLFLGVAMLVDLPKGWGATLAVVPAMWLASLTVNYPIKAMFRRRRPFLKHEDVVVIGARPADTSFPSGHTAAAFAGALLLSFQYPAWSPLFYAVALLVALSRIYLGVHFPLDVTMGAVIGMVLAAVYSAVLGWILPGLGIR